jgi:hypothetical protein
MTYPEGIHHPAFPPPATEDAALWRYMNTAKFEWLVTERRLYMPSVAQFPDRLEGMTPGGHTLWWEQQIAGAASEQDRAIATRNHAFLEEIAARWRQHYYVSCWHVNDAVNARMWPAYTTSTEAVAIRTSYRLLRASLPPFVEIGMVRYIDYRSADLPSMNILQRITHKDLRFDFEEELRAVAMRPASHEPWQAEFDGSLFESEAAPDVHIYAPEVEVRRLIEEVVLHPQASDEFAMRMKEQCARHGLPAPSVH